MTPQIITTLVILALAVLLFITEFVRADVVALMVMCCLALSGVLTPLEAVSGFSNSAVIIIWAVFILSGGLTRSGIASLLGRQMLRLSRGNELRLMLALMLISGVLSAFMNSVALAAMLLPIVMDIARQTGRSPSKLLIPMGQAMLLGGNMALIGTSSNIISNEALHKFGFKPFGIFDFTPLGVSIFLVAILFILLVGRHLLPSVNIAQSIQNGGQRDLGRIYDLDERMFVLHIPPGSLLHGVTLAQSRLRTALGLNVIGILRHGQPHLAPEPETVLHSGDRLVVIGRQEQVTDFQSWQHLIITEESPDTISLVSDKIVTAAISLPPHSQFIGQTVEEAGFRQRYGFNVLAIKRGETLRRAHFYDMPLHPQDTLMIQISYQKLEMLRVSPDFIFMGACEPSEFRLQERLIDIRIPQGSTLAGKTLEESRLGQAFSLNVLGILRRGKAILIPEAKEKLEEGDRLIVEGRREDVSILCALQDLHIDHDTTPDVKLLESGNYGLVEAVLHPRTSLIGKDLRQIRFREKYGLTVLAIWRNGRAFRSNLFDRQLQLGDALLLYGPHEKLKVLGSDPDFLVLSQEIQEAPNYKKAPLAAAIMGGVLLSTLLGWLPIVLATVIGAVLMVLTRCLNMDEAYNFIEWRTVFLISGMFSLGVAMEKSGAALLIADGLVSAMKGLGVMGVAAGFFILVALIVQLMSNSVTAVLMAPIAINTAINLGASPRAFIMIVIIAASTAFLTPFGHVVNLIIMGPGGYRFRDFVRAGFPLLVITFVATMLLLPIFFPF